MIEDTSNVDAVIAALDKAASEGSGGPVLLWLETPSNPLLRVTPLARVVAEAQKRGALTACDSTWMTPALCRPLEHGIDFVVHSTTKHIGGHSDLLGGVVIADIQPAEAALVPADLESESAPADAPIESKGASEREQLRDEVWAQVRLSQQLQGGVAAPFDAWLAMRGLRSLPARMMMAGASARVLASRLEEHPLVGQVHYPGLESHPGHAVTKEQTDWEQFGFGAMLSVRLPFGDQGDDSPDFAVETAARVRVFRRATSLGGTESLIEHRRTIEPEWSKTPASLLRVSVGLEYTEDLWRDIKTAIDGAARHLGITSGSTTRQ